MRQRQASKLPMTEIPLSEDDDEVVFTVLFDRTENARFSLHEVPRSG